MPHAAIPASDNFNRVDEDPMAGNWSTSTGADSWRISGNAAHARGGVNFTITYWNADTFTANQSSQATLVGSIGSAYYSAVGVRIQSGAASGYFCGAWGASSYIIGRMDNNAVTPLTTIGGSPTSSDVLKCAISSTTITFSLNGSSIGTASDPTYATGQPGLMGYDGAAALDDWTGDNVAGGGGGGSVPNALSTLGAGPGQ